MPETWEEVCLKERDEVLKGRFAHYCYDWDGLTVDETCHEFTSCNCTFAGDLEAEKAQVQQAMREQGCPDGPCPSCDQTGLMYP